MVFGFLFQSGGKPVRFKILSIVFFCSFYGPWAFGQEYSIEMSENDIAVNERFQIILKAEGDQIKKHGDFPDIEGFEKAGTSSSSSTRIVNGQMSSSHSIIQNYIPTKQGDFKVAPFSISINGQEVKSGGVTLSVGPPKDRKARRRDPFGGNSFFDQFFGKSEEDEQQYKEVEDNAFLGLTLDKDEVYVGEGLVATLAFYIANNNQASLQFHDVGNQLGDIKKALKPANCWEEDFNINRLDGEEVDINGKSYTQYKIYQAAFFPFNDQEIHFPEVELKMVKYQRARNPSFFSQNFKKGYKTFASKSRKVEVKPLPPHPLKNMVSVGDYELHEEIDTRQLKTGESFNYTFAIKGEGNISALEKPDLAQTQNFDIYAPKVDQNINHLGNKVFGEKEFQYYAVPKEPGDYKLGDYFAWVYFNTSKERYDTLKSSIALKVSGSSRKNVTIKGNSKEGIYARAEEASNKLADLKSDLTVRYVSFGVIGLMMVLSSVMILKGNKKN